MDPTASSRRSVKLHLVGVSKYATHLVPMEGKMFMHADYLQEVVDSMCQGHGFAFLSMVVMDTKECPYYIHAFEKARHTRLFFSAPNKSLIVMLEFVEHCGSVKWDFDQNRAVRIEQDFYECRWNARVWVAYNLNTWQTLQLQSAANLMREQPDNQIVPWMYEASIWKYVSFSGDGSTMEIHFTQVKTDHPDQAPDPAQVTEKFGKLYGTLKLSLYRRFRSLQVTNFPPAYCFPGCEKAFWNKFAVERLNKIASQIFGGSFQEQDRSKKQ